MDAKVKLLAIFAACMLCAGCANLQVKVKVGRPAPPIAKYPVNLNQ